MTFGKTIGANDWDGFMTKQFKAFDAVWAAYERICARMGELPFEDRELAYADQQEAVAEIRAWEADYRMGPAPRRERPSGGPVWDLMAEYRAAVKSAHASVDGTVYTCLPSYMFEEGVPGRLSIAVAQVPLHGDRAIDGAFAASGHSVMDYALRAAACTGMSWDGEAMDGRNVVRIGRDPVSRFYPSGGCLFDSPAAMFAVPVSAMEPEVCLVRGPGGIVPGTFGGEWTCEGGTMPEIREAMLVTGLPSVFFEHNQVVAGGTSLDGRRDAAMRGVSVPELRPDREGLSLA